MSMSKTDNNGGPAFPVTFEGGGNNGESPAYFEGMTLRDWFAGQALMGICAGLCSDHSHEGRQRAFDRVVFNDAAKDAYTLADAMIAAREGGAA
ncbi:hypothetical protein G6M02_07925 [Agrobacterium rhizogenes]|nr:hypothetical protein [Rhizobium rhizogenes]